mmetsp:Transcript_11523/g.48302  ORF Transcript_11523/g.48302 Transcript_11523/m.48302 type:complete len:253 (+) Transcript_11523:1528-2286(+)
MQHVRRVHGDRRDQRREDQQAHAPEQGVPLRLRRLHRPGRRLEHVQSRGGVVGGGVRLRRRRTGGGAGGEDGGRRAHHRRRPEQGQVPRGFAAGVHGRGVPLGPRKARAAGDRGRAHQVGRGLLVRLHRERGRDARRAGVRAQRLGRVLRHRRRRRGEGARHAAVPARHRSRLEGHGVRWLEVAQRRAETGRAVPVRRAPGGPLRDALHRRRERGRRRGDQRRHRRVALRRLPARGGHLRRPKRRRRPVMMT